MPLMDRNRGHCKSAATHLPIVPFFVCEDKAIQEKEKEKKQQQKTERRKNKKNSECYEFGRYTSLF